jgi:hypothetical protein
MRKKTNKFWDIVSDQFSSIFSLSRFTIVSEFMGLVNSVFTKVVVFLHLCVKQNNYES